FPLKSVAQCVRSSITVIGRDTSMSYHRSDRKAQKSSRNLRLLVLVLVLVFTTAIGLMHQLLKAGGPVGIDALCPFGAIEAAYSLIATGVIFRRIAVSNFILLGAVLATAVTFRRAFCGFVCPLGTLQELSGKLGKALLKRNVAVPAVIDKPARCLKYVVLAVTVVLSAITATLVIRPYDPWVAYHHLVSSNLFSEFLWGFAVLVLTVVGSFLFSRVFCKYLCPMGAFLAAFHRFGWLGIERNPDTCIDCGACDRACPVDVKVSGSGAINDAECLSCAECVNACPVKDTLYIGKAKGVRISATKALGIVVAIVLVVVGTTTITRDFQWTTVTLAEQAQDTGQFDAESIRGRMTLAEVADAAGIPPSAFKAKFEIDDGDLSLPIRDLREKHGFETEQVRAFVKEYLRNR
ncbi:MAG: 4Fe-4S binding protein, partial [Chloroflexota bacterium]